MEAFTVHTGNALPFDYINVDTDQIIPAEHLVYSLSDPEERKNYGKFALSGVPAEQAGLPKGNTPFTENGQSDSRYSIIEGPSCQGVFSLEPTILSPFRAEIGTAVISSSSSASSANERYWVTISSNTSCE